MNLTKFELANLLTFTGLIFTGIAVLWAVYVYRKQMNAQLFLEYTKRYDSILQSCPDKFREGKLEARPDLPERSEEFTRCALRYLNLCSEEFYLWKRGYLSSDIWNIWKEEIERTIDSPLFRREWDLINPDFPLAEVSNGSY